MYVKKSTIENAAISGLPLDPADVVRVSRSGRVVTYRHRWSWESDDARVTMAVTQAAMRVASELARKHGRGVEIYDPRGWMTESVEEES